MKHPNIEVITHPLPTNSSLIYQWLDTSLGQVLVGCSPLGVCWMAYVDVPSEGLEEFMGAFPGHTYQQKDSPYFSAIASWLMDPSSEIPVLPIHLMGTNFQQKVWLALVKINWGQTTDYQTVAQSLGSPDSARAVGTAIGKNPVAVLVPCHRVLRTDGSLGGYRWGIDRKIAWLKREGAPYLF
jgi:AraC family transcriptional regulator of adaptative response/methylated-DNA-[protein]-cysteine methyltransferase